MTYARRQLLLARELWARTQARELGPDDTMEVYRRNLNRGLGRTSLAASLLSKYVGGAYTSRATAGANKPLVAPVPAAQQREALSLLLSEVFSSSSFRFDPRYMSRLGVDQRGFISGRAADFSLATSVLGIQRTVLDQMMSDGIAQRLADAEVKVNDRSQLLSYAEVQERLSRAVWAELSPGDKGKGEIDSLRRNLQREHLRRLAGGLLRPGAATAADVRAVHRQAALQLQTRLAAAVAARRGSSLARAHLEDSLATLNEALKAPLLKQGV
jgi:hypothetical protein